MEEEGWLSVLARVCSRAVPLALRQAGPPHGAAHQRRAALAAWRTLHGRKGFVWCARGPHRLPCGKLALRTGRRISAGPRLRPEERHMKEEVFRVCSRAVPLALRQAGAAHGAAHQRRAAPRGLENATGKASWFACRKAENWHLTVRRAALANCTRVQRATGQNSADERQARLLQHSLQIRSEMASFGNEGRQTGPLVSTDAGARGCAASDPRDFPDKGRLTGKSREMRRFRG